MGLPCRSTWFFIQMILGWGSMVTGVLGRLWTGAGLPKEARRPGVSPQPPPQLTLGEARTLQESCVL